MGWLQGNFITPLNLFHHWECWSGMAFNKRVRKGYCLIWHATIWTLWKVRNDKIFNNGGKDANSIVEEVKVLSWRWSLTRLDIPSCMFYDWCWDLKACLLRVRVQEEGCCSVLFWGSPVRASAVLWAELRVGCFGSRVALGWRSYAFEIWCLNWIAGHSFCHLREWYFAFFMIGGWWIWVFRLYPASIVLFVAMRTLCVLCGYCLIKFADSKKINSYTVLFKEG